MKKTKKNMFGFSHHALLGLVVVAVVALTGVKVLVGTHAQDLGIGTETPYGTLKKIEQIAKNTQDKYGWWNLKPYLTNGFVSSAQYHLNIAPDGDLAKLEHACLHNFTCKTAVKNTTFSTDYTSIPINTGVPSSHYVLVKYKLSSINLPASLTIGNKYVFIFMLGDKTGTSWKVAYISVGNKYWL